MAYEPKFGGRQKKLRVGRANATANDSQVNGSGISLIKVYSATVDHASCAAVSSVSTSVTVTGVSTDDMVICCEPGAALTSGLVISNVRVTAANTVVITVANVTAGAIDQASTTYRIVTLRSASADY